MRFDFITDKERGEYTYLFGYFFQDCSLMQKVISVYASKTDRRDLHNTIKPMGGE
jgi:hypothetical protein